MGFLGLHMELPHGIVISAVEITYLRNPWPWVSRQRMKSYSIDPDGDELYFLISEQRTWKWQAAYSEHQT